MEMRFSGSILFGLLLAIPTSVLCASAPTVTLKSGVVIGTTTRLPGATASVDKYIGVPFAEPPTGTLRFASPVPHASWTAPVKATQTKPGCLSFFAYPADGRNKSIALFNNPYPPNKPLPESEDCLYVNVYAPAGAGPQKLKPVMVWIYGGNLGSGTTGFQIYDGSSFATNEDIVLVGINYRTNIFGFPNSPEVEYPNQNPGFLDQRLALDWVQANIAAFGGDPKAVTIFGQSSGGYSVKQLIAMPPEPLNFRAAIMQSNGLSATADAGINWSTLVVLLGCSKAKSHIECVRKVDGAKIKDIIEHKNLGFSPVQDSVTFVSDIRNSSIAGRAAKIPIIVGSNKDEGRPFLYIAGLDNPSTSPEQLKKDLAFAFPSNLTLQASLLAQLAGKIAYRSVSTALNQAIILCPTHLLADYYVSNGYTVYRYFLRASFPNQALFPDPGAWHSSEIPLVFGTYPSTNVTAEQRTFSRSIQNAWAQFARNPATGPRPSGTWPALGSNTLGNGNIQVFSATGEHTRKSRHIDQSCIVWDPLTLVTGL